MGSLAPAAEEPTSSGDSGDESGSEPESPAEKARAHPHAAHWQPAVAAHRDRSPRPASPSGNIKNEPTASTSSSSQDVENNKQSNNMLKQQPKLNLPGGAMLYHPGVLAGIDGLGPNLGLGNLAMAYPQGFILGLANQGQDAAVSSSQPQFITIPLSMAMAAAAGVGSAGAAGGSATATCAGAAPPSSSDDSSELQDLTTGTRK
ncbi:hypothetical protein EVAR_22705_1 [Eumeta japonica]|uniref:Uncharacterized protein n=1 Tax=Eumeta variegata TaxID=151549 RepID=A0A4C1US84_EUMVA|nr:hypothetical protein EVAR_22705_1 [Eumeta japonica]